MIDAHGESCAEAFAARAARRARARRDVAGRERNRCDSPPGSSKCRARSAQALDASHREHPLAGRFAEDRARVLAHGFDVVQYAARSGPPALAEDAGTRTVESLEEACARHCVARARDDGPATPEDYLARAILRPWFEVLRERGVAPERVHGPARVRSAAAPLRWAAGAARRERRRRRARSSARPAVSSGASDGSAARPASSPIRRDCRRSPTATIRACASRRASRASAT